MKIKDKYKVIYNKRIKNDIYLLSLIGIRNAITNPGQFVEVTIPGVFLPRPFSVAYSSQEEFWLAYKVVGEGTKMLSKYNTGDFLEILTGLGNGFDLNVKMKKPLLIGGGMGIAPLYYLAIALKDKGIEPKILLGYKKEEDIFFFNEFKENFKSVQVMTEDNSCGEQGVVTDVMNKIDYDYFYACGPKTMLKAINDIALTDGEFSLEAHMSCGIGNCKCCSMETTSGMKTLCKDGPVLKKGEIIW
jgi:dihydroorotate dehydrogenase electron transfer subunit